MLLDSASDFTPKMRVTVDMKPLNQRFYDLQKLGLSGHRILRVETRRILQSVMKQTYPKTSSQGAGAVRRDLRKVFMPVEPRVLQFGNRQVKSSIKGGASLDYVPLWTTSGGVLVACKRENFKPFATAETMAEIHKRARGKSGRVSGFGGAVSAIQRGKLNFINRIVVKRAEFNRYQREVVRHVGKLRSGFARALQAVGGRVPAWVARHAQGEGGPTGFVKVSNAGGFKNSITIGNTAAGARPRIGGILQRVVAGRVKAIGKNIRRMMKHGPGKSNDYGYATQ